MPRISGKIIDDGIEKWLCQNKHVKSFEIMHINN